MKLGGQFRTSVRSIWAVGVSPKALSGGVSPLHAGQTPPDWIWLELRLGSSISLRLVFDLSRTWLSNWTFAGPRRPKMAKMAPRPPQELPKRGQKGFPDTPRTVKNTKKDEKDNCWKNLLPSRRNAYFQGFDMFEINENSILRRRKFDIFEMLSTRCF